MADCKSCKSNNYKDEITSAFLERANKRLWVVIILLILVIAGMFIYDKWEDSQYEDMTITQEVVQDAENGENHFIGGNDYGKTENTDNN